MRKEGTILIVDDEEDILLTLRLFLKQHFSRVVTEHNPHLIPRMLRMHEPDVILLDNMTNEQLVKAVAKNKTENGGLIKLEASGNVNIDTIKAIAETGVDYISTSKITMAAPTLDR